MLVFLTTFLLGIAFVRAIDTIFLSEVEISGIRNGLQPINIRRPTPRQDIEPLEIVYDGRMPVGLHYSTEERFRLTNVGPEPIYFDSNDNDNLTAHISNAAGLNKDVTFRVTVQELQPGDWAYGFVWIPIDDAKYYDLSIDYTVGHRHVRRSSFF